MSKQKPTNLFLFLSVLIYGFATLPLIQSLYILVFGILLATFLKNQQDQFVGMFGFGARLLTRIFAKSRTAPAPLRDEALKVCAAIDQYPKLLDSIVYRKKQLFFMLNDKQRKAATDTYKRLLQVQNLQDANYKFLQKIKEFAKKEFGLSELDIRGAASAASTQYLGNQANELLEHFVRDWSNSGFHEASRSGLLKPFEPWLKNKKRVLVPGSGLGRLAANVATDQQGNGTVDAPELSACMWLGAKYATSQTEKVTEKIYPYLLQYSYWRHGADQLEAVPLQFDKHEHKPNFTCENFLEMKPESAYDAIATLYFIDTAQNVFEYIDKIASLLAPGGVWCNYGPLKWGSAPFVEFSVDELFAYLKSSGWKIVETWEDGENNYNGSPKSMLASKYKLIGWVAKR